MKELFQYWQGFALIGGAAVAGLIAQYLIFKIIDLTSRETRTVLDDALVKHCRAPSRLILPLLLLHFVFPIFDLPAGVLIFMKRLFGSLLIASLAWLIINLTHMLEAALLERFKMDARDNLRARKILTQIQILKKAVIAVVAVLAVAAVLMTFDRVRHLGASILASAGIAGIIIGLAAQRSIGTMLAGLQIALTQPIRLDDVVIVENEWGRIEEITLTYVVVRIWDLRRLVVPITYFIEKPFQNWTRVTADILGTVFLYVDYSAPVDAIRGKFHQILKDSKLWDGKLWGLQVTNATEKTIELRALMSAPDASAAWDLRCEVREKLIDYIKQNYPESLSRHRAEIQHP